MRASLDRVVPCGICFTTEFSKPEIDQLRSLKRDTQRARIYLERSQVHPSLHSNQSLHPYRSSWRWGPVPNGLASLFESGSPQAINTTVCTAFSFPVQRIVSKSLPAD
jgi:hypothetical protein